MKVKILIILLLFTTSIFGQEPDATPPAKANARPEATPTPQPEPFDNATLKELTKCVSLNTEIGSIELEMFPGTAPITVRNFLNLTAIKAFDNTTFSRVVPKFVIQGGVLSTNKNITYEMSLRELRPLPDEPNLVRHVRGIVSMARGDEPNSAGTSFFILVDDAPYLDNKFAAFARVTKGMDLVDKINQAPVENEEPKNPVVVKNATVIDCDGVVDKDTATQTADQPAKINDLPRFGFRGKVKSVRESTSEIKGKKKDWKKADQHSIGESFSEFGDIGDYIKATFYDKEGAVTGVNTSESTIWGAGVGAKAKDFFKSVDGKILAQTHVERTSENEFSFTSYDEKMNLVRRGKTTTDENGRFLKQSYERFGKDEKTDGSFTTTFTYDAYGFMTSRIQVDGEGKRVFYNRFEYPELDDRANWVVRLIFDSEDSKRPVRIVRRKFEYYPD